MKHGQDDHDHCRGRNDDELRRADEACVRLQERQIGQKIGEGEKVRRLGDKDVILKEDGHADGADQREKAGSLAERLVGDLLYGESVGGGVDHSDDRCKDQDGEAAHSRAWRGRSRQSGP